MMNSKNLEEKLTPAAKNALTELIENYKDQVLFGAITSATELTGEVEEITVRDIINGIEKSKINILDKKANYRKRLLRLTMFVGFFYALIGIGYFLYKNLPLEFPNQIGLIAAFAGLTLSLMSYFLLNIYKEKYQFNLKSTEYNKADYFSSGLELLLVNKWSEIELAARDLFASKMGESKANMTFTNIIEFLAKKEILNKEDYIKSKKLLDMRNRILHKGKNFNKIEIDEAIYIANKILNKIRANNI